MTTNTPTESYPHPELTPIAPGAKPDFASLKVIHQELNANAMSIPSTRGGGQHGHLAITLNDADYLAINNAIAWINPVHPGPAPVHAPGASGPQITEVNRAYKADLEEYQLYSTVIATLKKQLIAAIPETYIKAMKDDLIGYANVNVRELLEHLDTTYGVVTSDDLQDNEDAMDKVWSPTQPLEDLWNQILACKKYAEPHDPISDKKMIRSAIANLESSGVFSHGLTKWREKDTATQTWTNLLTHFAKQDKERQRKLTAGDAGYAGAVLRDTTNVPSNNPASTKKPTAEGITGMAYCWSHGLSVNLAHDSKTCSNRQPGHRAEATLFNMLGGCCVIKRKFGERAVYKRPPFVPRDAAPATTGEP